MPTRDTFLCSRMTDIDARAATLDGTTGVPAGVQKTHRVLAAAGYVAMIAATVALVLAIQRYGASLTAPSAVEVIPPASSIASSTGDTLRQVLVALLAVTALCQLLARAFRYIGQPPVIGEVVAGIVLGPSVLGAIAPDLAQLVVAPAVVPHLALVSQLGIVVYMFLVGVRLNPAAMLQRAHATIATSHAGIVVPFVLGTGLALYLYPRFATADVPFTSFALFIGISMSITAFPVLARILDDLGMSGSRLGVLALACAAIDDVTAWCLLALVVGIAHASAASAVVTTLSTLAFIAVMLLAVRPWLAGRLQRVNAGDPRATNIALALLGLLLAALITESIGVHALFGAFLFGVVIPHDSRLARALAASLESFVAILLLPAFFAAAGLRTEVGLLRDAGSWLALGLILLVATAGKFGGTLVAARLVGFGWRPAAALGMLMNTRGLMQLIVLNIGFDLGLLSQTLFTMMVLMALATTVVTTPIVRRLLA